MEVRCTWQHTFLHARPALRTCTCCATPDTTHNPDSVCARAGATVCGATVRGARVFLAHTTHTHTHTVALGRARVRRPHVQRHVCPQRPHPHYRWLRVHLPKVIMCVCVCARHALRPRQLTGTTLQAAQCPAAWARRARRPRARGGGGGGMCVCAVVVGGACNVCVRARWRPSACVCARVPVPVAAPCAAHASWRLHCTCRDVHVLHHTNTPVGPPLSAPAGPGAQIIVVVEHWCGVLIITMTFAVVISQFLEPQPVVSFSTHAGAGRVCWPCAVSVPKPQPAVSFSTHACAGRVCWPRVLAAYAGRVCWRPRVLASGGF